MTSFGDYSPDRLGPVTNGVDVGDAEYASAIAIAELLSRDEHGVVRVLHGAVGLLTNRVLAIGLHALQISVGPFEIVPISQAGAIVILEIVLKVPQGERENEKERDNERRKNEEKRRTI